MALKVINPATEELIETVQSHSAEDIDRAITGAWERFRSWRLVSFEERARLMLRAAEVLEANAARYAHTMTEEMGKPLAQAEGEVKKCAWVCRHYADHAADYLADEQVATDAKKSYVRHLPIGPVLAVMPWNFPFWQVFRFAAPTLMAGNVGLLKHASNVPRSGLNIEEVFREAGFPEHCFTTLLIGSGLVEKVLKDSRVRAATLTGSGPAGAAVASLAGQEIKPSVLELGGSDAFIVMPSADFDSAVETAVKARTQNNGQSCIAAKRFFVHEAIYDRFAAAMTERFDALCVGDPMVAGTDIGPLAQEQGRQDVLASLEVLLSLGARVLTKSRNLPAKGWFVEPTALEIPRNAEGHFVDDPDNEIFGPVAKLYKVRGLSEAIEISNASELGLGSAIFTQDEAEIEEAVRDLEAGSTFVNAMVSSDPRLPFGGVKVSGYGRELARDGILAFVNRKTVSIN